MINLAVSSSTFCLYFANLQTLKILIAIMVDDSCI